MNTVHVIIAIAVVNALDLLFFIRFVNETKKSAVFMSLPMSGWVCFIQWLFTGRA